MKNLCVFFVSITLLMVGQILWKVAAAQSSSSNMLELFVKMFFNIYFIGGLAFYFVSTICWIYLLGKFEFSVIYPIFVGVSIVLSSIVGFFIFKERTHLIYKMIGVFFIIIGVFFVGKYK